MAAAKIAVERSQTADDNAKRSLILRTNSRALSRDFYPEFLDLDLPVDCANREFEVGIWFNPKALEQRNPNRRPGSPC